MSFISGFLSRFINLKIPVPHFIKQQELLFICTGVVSIIFIEEYTHMAFSTTKTAYLILGIFFGAVIFDIIFEKSAWCRHLCPLGGMGGIFSMSSMLEIRANKHTCATICTTHDCYKGTAKVSPCPMFLHLQFLSDNRNCKFCLNCIKSCKHNSPRLNLRIPGAEISSLKDPALAGAIMSIILCGLLIAEVPYKMGIRQTGFTLLFFITVFFALSLTFVSSYLVAFISKDTMVKHLRHFGYTLIPLTLFGYMALKLKEVIGDSEGSLMLFSIYKFSFNVTTACQAFLVITGFFITEYLIYKIIKNRIEERKQFNTFIIQGIVPLIFAILYVSLFYNMSYTNYL
jgi:hypothetical protein